MTQAQIVAAASGLLLLDARKKGYYTDDMAWNAAAEITRKPITRRLVNAVKRETARELALNGEEIPEQ